jgi:hypothetical protein
MLLLFSKVKSMTGRLLPVLLLLGFLLGLVACSSGSSSALKTISGLPGGFDGPHVQNIGANSVEIVFKSKIPIVCNVAFGKDLTYGRIALMAMTGPVTDHDVALLSLEPDSTYHYRITITDTSGVVYQSGDYTFSTAVAGVAQVKPAGTNVAAAAAGARVSGVSSNWQNGDLNSSFGGNKAIDGRTDTEWSSNGDGDKAWIEITLAHTYALSSLGFQTRSMGDTAKISSFRVITDDGTQLGPFSLPDAATIYYFPVNVKTKTLRFEVVGSSGGNTGVVEIEAFAQ